MLVVNKATIEKEMWKPQSVTIYKEKKKIGVGP